MRNGPQLIAYVDRLAGDLPSLHDLLRGPFGGAFTGAHLLPFFDPIDGSDAGFDPSDHEQVDPRLGSWSDVERLGDEIDLMADLIVNHVSSESRWFRDWVDHGDDSPASRMFVTAERVFGGPPTPDQIARIYRPRPTPPFHAVELSDGTRHDVWTTFTAEQIDIDVESEIGWNYLCGILDRLAQANVRIVRLDAIGYSIKRRDTSCFMIPETFDFIDRLSAACRDRGMEVLVEVHGHHQDQIAIARRVDRVYDFALPPLVIDALTTGDGTALRQWIDIRPHNSINVLDTHDGIGIIDVGPGQRDPTRRGLLSSERIERLVAGIHERSHGVSEAATGTSASNLDVYQVNCTFYDALGRDDSAYLAARLIQLLLPGIPQVYYVGALAGTNDIERLTRTGVGRDVNRHVYTPSEIASELERPVVAELFDMLRWRATDPAFDGDFELVDSAPHELRIRWTSPSSVVDRTVDLHTGAITIG